MIGRAVRSAREQLGWTQKQVCAGLCDRSMLSHIENNETMPSIDLLIHLCRRLSLDVGTILKDYEQEPTDAHSLLNHLEKLHIDSQFSVVVGQGRKFLTYKSIAGSHELLANVLYRIAKASHALGDFSAALEYFERGAKLLSNSGPLNTYISCENGVASALAELGQLSMSMGKYSECLASIVPTTDVRLQIRLKYNVARLMRQMEEASKGLRLAEEASALCGKSGVHEAGGAIKTLLGLYWKDASDPIRAQQYFRDALGFYQYVGDFQSMSGVRHNLSELGVTMTTDF